jgi:hypothetical protein
MANESEAFQDLAQPIQAVEAWKCGTGKNKTGLERFEKQKVTHCDKLQGSTLLDPIRNSWEKAMLVGMLGV